MDQGYYRKKAMECLAAAERIREPEHRFELLSIAQSFVRLAAYIATRHDPAAPNPDLHIKVA
jgi:hypothetical protein